jgi:outer membrane protein OmpA-like peptidoglycan-associated protein
MRMRATILAASAAALLGLGGAVAGAGADELVGKDAILKSLLGKTRSISSKQRTAVNLPSVTFDFNSATLTPQGKQQLDILAEALKEGGLNGRPITIEGHTDAKGSEDYNLKLSERRAAAAEQYLVGEAGLDPAHLSSVGYGKQRLLPDKPAYAADQRRIEVVVGTP